MEKTNIYALVDSKGIIFYIGKASDIKTRFKQHLYLMLKENPTKIYNSFRKHIPFSPILLEEVLVSEWEQKEIYYIDLHKDTLYNRAVGGRHSYSVKSSKDEDIIQIDLKSYSEGDLISCGLTETQIKEIFGIKSDKNEFDHDAYTRKFYSKTKQINLNID